MRGVEAGAEPVGAPAQQGRVAVAGIEQVVQEFAPHALFGVAGGAAGEQQQGGDHGGAFEGALVDRVEGGVAAQDESTELLVTGGDGGYPVVAVADRVAVGAQGAGGGLGHGVDELDAAVEDLGDGGGHIVHAAAAQDQFGEAVVDVGGAFDDGAAVLDDLVGVFEFAERGAGPVEEVGRLDGRRGQRGERAEQRGLGTFEDPGTPVGGEQDADDVRAEHQRDAEDRDEPLVLDPGVDDRGVLEAAVVEVVLGDVGAGGLGDEAAEALAHAEAQLLEAGGDRALGDAHERVPARGVVEGEVGDVRAEQRAGPLHDGLEHRVQVARPGEVVGGLEEGGQLGLAAPAVGEFGADPQREALGVFERGEVRLAGTRLTGGGHGLLVRLDGGAPGEEFEERRLGTGRGEGAGGGVRPIVRHVHQEYLSCRCPASPWSPWGWRGGWEAEVRGRRPGGGPRRWAPRPARPPSGRRTRPCRRRRPARRAVRQGQFVAAAAVCPGRQCPRGQLPRSRRRPSTRASASCPAVPPGAGPTRPSSSRAPGSGSRTS
ncbi:hypothetical protein Sdia_40390 [Streptomyces diastaticus subsp. diastaticus]|uniref:Uncharacterized protein n=1 Tax=Streptomyces diastaticus subsp. diastaticus TaxID=68040 RepID=A0ABQ1CSZ2_STRDI|nr:hypothetical protein Sdia_40390 [Streptomyces diastaticus subsp. diastaticus]GGU10785.1 hypothetical protein GCM10015534_11580 [Streptomyces diastaticus subsp. diastaticus]